jgi:hypothetical protein
MLEDANWATIWGPLNDACPFLTSLVIFGGSHSLSPVIDPVVFKCLKLLKMGYITPVGVEFPTLRHVSASNIRGYSRQMEAITRCPDLESLLLREMDHSIGLDWNQFPKLRLLGVPATHLWIISRCPRDHPLSHLCIYVSARRSSSELVEATLERLPTINRLTVDAKSIPRHNFDIVARECVLAGLDLVDSPYGSIRRSVLFATSWISPVAAPVTHGMGVAARMVGMVLVTPPLLLFFAIWGPLDYGQG